MVAKRRLSGNAWDFFANRATVATTEGAAKLQATFVVSGGVYPTTAHTHSALQTAKLGNANMILDPPLIQNTLSSTFLVPSNEVTSKRKHHKVLGTFSDSSLDPPLISDSGHTKSSISMNLYASGNKHTSVPSVRRIPGFDFENSPKTC